MAKRFTPSRYNKESASENGGHLRVFSDSEIQFTTLQFLIGSSESVSERSLW